MSLVAGVEKLKAFCCAVAIVTLAMPVSAGELPSFPDNLSTGESGTWRMHQAEWMAEPGPSGARTADLVANGDPRMSPSKLPPEASIAGSKSIQSALRAKVRQVKAQARAALRKSGIDPRDVRMRLRVRCTKKYAVVRRRAPALSGLPALMQSAVASIDQSETEIVGSMVETCTVRLSMQRKKRRKAQELKDFSVELPALHAQTN